MAEFLHIIGSFPTVLFTVGMALASIYWLLTIIGALDIEVLDGLTGDLDMDLDVDVDVDVDLEADADADLDGASAGIGAWFASAIRLGRVPVAVTASLMILGGWVASFLVTWGAIQLDIPQGTAVTAVASAAAFAGAMVFTNTSTRPLEPLFRTVAARSNHDLVGEVCLVTTGRVDAEFGQAELAVDSDHLTIPIRCDQPGSALRRGRRALIVHFDSTREAFVVEPLVDPATQRTADRAASGIAETDLS